MVSLSSLDHRHRYILCSIVCEGPVYPGLTPPWYQRLLIFSCNVVRFTELPGPCGRVPEMLGVSRTCNVRAGITVAKWSCARLRVLSSSASNTSPAVPPDSPGGPHLKGLTVSLRPAWNDIHPSAVVHPDAILGEVQPLLCLSNLHSLLDQLVAQH